MDHCSTITFHQALSCCSSDTKENEEPVDVRITAKDSVSAIKASVNKQITTPSSTKGTINRKDRRALHNVDNNCPRVQVHSPSCSQLNSSSCVSKDAIEAKKVQVQSTSSKQALHEADKTVEGLVKGHKRSVVAVDDDENSYTDSSSRLDHLESENLAWMDMMLALLEKRYDANFALPVCLTDLEAANVLQLPQRKRLKTGIASAQVKSKRGLDTTRRQTTFTNAFNNSKMPATKVHQASEQLNERKRQRLILRHAQQIQASTVSSSTSCGCKTGCLKMYCLCFSSRGFCHARCTCDDCKNNRMNQTGRVEAIQNYIANDPRAFSYALLPQDTNNTSGFLHLLPQKSSAVVMRGCRCKKSKCLKKYCECFQNGIVCTSHCRCMDCSNQSETCHLKIVANQYKSIQTRTFDRKPFHPVQITVTKQPRRNYVSKTLRLNL